MNTIFARSFLQTSRQGAWQRITTRRLYAQPWARGQLVCSFGGHHHSSLRRPRSPWLLCNTSKSKIQNKVRGFAEVTDIGSPISRNTDHTTPQQASASSTANTMSTRIDQTGHCLCGAVKFSIQGNIIFNQLCHCRACSRARGMSPVHLIGVKGELTYQNGGIDSVVTVSGLGSMEHTNCRHCGVGIYQRPKGRSFYAMFPTTFHIETPSDDAKVPSCLLPSHLWAQSHVNYENRLQNVYDTLPKYKTWSSGPRMTNDGQVIQESPDTKV